MRAPPRLPRPLAANRTLRSPPVPGITTPQRGSADTWFTTPALSSSLNNLSASARYGGVSTTVCIVPIYGNAVVNANPATARRAAFWGRRQGRSAAHRRSLPVAGFQFSHVPTAPGARYIGRGERDNDSKNLA